MAVRYNNDELSVTLDSRSSCYGQFDDVPIEDSPTCQASHPESRSRSRTEEVLFAQQHIISPQLKRLQRWLFAATFLAALAFIIAIVACIRISAGHSHPDTRALNTTTTIRIRQSDDVLNTRNSEISSRIEGNVTDIDPDPVWSTWSSWSSCAPKCGQARSKKRSRTCLQGEKDRCQGALVQWRNCPDVDCEPEDDWSFS